ncbi:hypothetical protein D9757_014684 [Collybiopsis confluens]|uniref:PUM-HD domain-containing protein n=1 Tax=Collybiopsis confluens TaxID=2823264 RepID=A0A8H5FT76_9AGAR|nr:hypothetical protein D9757_014684 [Collybiopsis confluens]
MRTFTTNSPIAPYDHQIEVSSAQHLSVGNSVGPLALFSKYISAHVELKLVEHERQRATHRQLFENQMRALEQQQTHELLSLSLDASVYGTQHLAAGALDVPLSGTLGLSSQLLTQGSHSDGSMNEKGLPFTIPSQIIGHGFDDSPYDLGCADRIHLGASSKLSGLHRKGIDIPCEPMHFFLTSSEAVTYEVDILVNRLAGTHLQDLSGKILGLCKDRHGCWYLQKKLEDSVPADRSLIFDETLGHLVDLMKDPLGNYVCQKLFEFSTNEQREIIYESIIPDLVSISLNTYGSHAVQRMIEFLSTRSQICSTASALSLHVASLIKDLHGNHVIQKLLTKLAARDNQVIADKCLELATDRHGYYVLQRCIDYGLDHQRIRLVNDLTFHSLALAQDPYGSFLVQHILALDDNRFKNAVIRQFAGNVCALSITKFGSIVIEKCIRVAEPSARNMLIEELIDCSRLEKLLQDSFGNYCVQTALKHAKPAQYTLLIEGIRPVLPLISGTSYGMRIQRELQLEEKMVQPGKRHSANVV